MHSLPNAYPGVYLFATKQPFRILEFDATTKGSSGTASVGGTFTFDIKGHAEPMALVPWNINDNNKSNKNLGPAYLVLSYSATLQTDLTARQM